MAAPDYRHAGLWDTLFSRVCGWFINSILTWKKKKRQTDRKKERKRERKKKKKRKKKKRKKSARMTRRPILLEL